MVDISESEYLYIYIRYKQQLRKSSVKQVRYNEEYSEVQTVKWQGSEAIIQLHFRYIV